MAKFHRTRLAIAVESREDQARARLVAVFAEWARSISKKAARLYTTRKLLKATKSVEAMVKEILDNLGIEEMADDVAAEIATDLRAMFTAAAKTGLEQVKLEPSNEITNHLDVKAREYADARAAELVGKRILSDGSIVDNPSTRWSIAETTREDLRAVLTDGVEQGWSSKFMADNIESSGAFGEARALMIARTELAMAHVAGNVAGWKESGEVSHKRSLLGDNHDHLDECDENADAGAIPFDEDFPSGDAFPPYHPNCICDVEPILREPEESDA